MHIRRSTVAPVLLALAVGLAAGPARAGTEEPISLATTTGTIAGTLMRPDGARQAPVVLLIAGSGPTDRDGNPAASPIHPNTLKLLAAALADAGFASVRYDKRGIAGSAAAGAREQDLRFETYVADAAAWVAKLATDDRFGAVAIAGHSEGSLIGMMAAREQPAVKAFVSLEGPAQAAGQALRQQMDPRLAPALATRNDAILDTLEHGQTVPEVPAQLGTFYRASVQPYLISWFRYRPADVFGSLGMPSLVVQGDRDMQVPASEADALLAANPRAERLMVAGMTHPLKLAPPGPDGAKAAYLDPSLPLAPALTQGLLAFLAKHLPAHPNTNTP